MKEMQPVDFYINKEGLAEVDINAASDWESFDKLIKYLEIHFEAEVKYSGDGAGERIAQLEIDKVSLVLCHDDFYGNTLKAVKENGNLIVEEIFNDLKRRFQI